MSSEHGVRFGPQTGPDARFECGAPQHPGERSGRGGVPGADQSHDLVAYLGVREPLVVDECFEHVEGVARWVSKPLGDLGVNEGIDCSAVATNPGSLGEGERRQLLERRRFDVVLGGRWSSAPSCFAWTARRSPNIVRTMMSRTSARPTGYRSIAAVCPSANDAMPSMAMSVCSTIDGIQRLSRRLVNAARTVVLDACVLYPPALRDFLLTVAALDGFVPIWSDVILDEVERNVLEDNPTIDPTIFRTHTLALN